MATAQRASLLASEPGNEISASALISFQRMPVTVRVEGFEWAIFLLAMILLLLIVWFLTWLARRRDRYADPIYRRDRYADPIYHTSKPGGSSSVASRNTPQWRL